jgi:OOP family OmpA-OmpF porin
MPLKTRLIVPCLFIVSLFVAGAARAEDAEGSKDHPLFSRMPGYSILRYEERDFDVHSFYGPKQEEIPVEGKYYHYRYLINEGAKEPSRIQILRNYENAFKKIGGTILLSDWDGHTYMKLVKDGREVWVHVAVGITPEWDLFIVEKGAMAQEVTADAKFLADGLRSTGHVAVYGILFDTGKSVIKPASEAALAEIGKLLKNESALKLNVVGHTDGAGDLASNMKLSQARAEAVVQALTARHGVAPARLKAYGVGPLAPVASNDNYEGKAKNRRVELVKQ